MRDILFRGKRVDNGEWVYGSLISFADGRKSILPSDSKIYMPVGSHMITSNNCYDVAPDTVWQYTGLTDANGAKIFENDILFDEFGENYCVVKFGEYASPMGPDRYTANVGFYTAWVGKHKALLRQDLGYWIKSMKGTTRVVGNIYDNPDMLTDKGEG